MQAFLRMLGSASGITPAEANAKLNSDNPPFLLDVREQSEFRMVHITQAKLIPLSELGRRMGELPKDREIVCVCQSGSRSGAAARQLSQAGYTVLNLNGGMMAWQMAGLPVKRAK